MTGGSRPIATVFILITASQLALGIYLIYLTALHAGGPWSLSRSLSSPC